MRTRNVEDNENSRDVRFLGTRILHVISVSAGEFHTLGAVPLALMDFFEKSKTFRIFFITL